MKRKYLVMLKFYGTTVCGKLTFAGIAWLVRYHYWKPQIIDVADEVHPRELTLMYNKDTKVMALFDPAGRMVDQISMQAEMAA